MLEESDDLFADFEATLIEDPDNPSVFKKNEENSTSYLQIKNTNMISGPARRTYLLYEANVEFEAKNYLKSIYYETKALCVWMEVRYKATQIMETENLPQNVDIHDYLNSNPNETMLFQYFDDFLHQRPEKLLKNIEFKNCDELTDLCKELPDEWMVLQICKQLNEDQHWQTVEQNLKTNRPISLTLLRYPHSEYFNHQPIKILLHDCGTLYSTAAEICAKVADWKIYQKIKFDEYELKVLEPMKTFLGPWIILFYGSPKTVKDKKAEESIFTRTKALKLSKRQTILTFLIARHSYLLKKKEITDVANYIGKNEKESEKLITFFMALNQTEKKYNRNPVILVVDPNVDFFHWEMCVPSQEFTRVESVITLFQLYFYHKSNISNGYCNVSFKQASTFLDPENNLPLLEHTVYKFLKNSNQNWNIELKVKPTFSVLNKYLSTSDIYVYCGHGSGLQFISAHETSQLKSNAVIFLSGCCSVMLKSTNGFCLPSGAHQYYHMAKCPAVLGNTEIIGCIYADLQVIVSLRNWLSINYELCGICTDENKESKALLEHFLWLLNQATKATKSSPYLTEVIRDYRHINEIPPTSRAMYCYRGLPVYLKSK